jgi:hypothetical protein
LRTSALGENSIGLSKQIEFHFTSRTIYTTKQMLPQISAHKLPS